MLDAIPAHSPTPIVSKCAMVQISLCLGLCLNPIVAVVLECASLSTQAAARPNIYSAPTCLRDQRGLQSDKASSSPLPCQMHVVHAALHEPAKRKAAALFRCLGLVSRLTTAAAFLAADGLSLGILAICDTHCASQSWCARTFSNTVMRDWVARYDVQANNPIHVIRLILRNLRIETRNSRNGLRPVVVVECLLGTISTMNFKSYHVYCIGQHGTRHKKGSRRGTCRLGVSGPLRAGKSGGSSSNCK